MCVIELSFLLFVAADRKKAVFLSPSTHHWIFALWRQYCASSSSTWLCCLTSSSSIVRLCNSGCCDWWMSSSSFIVFILFCGVGFVLCQFLISFLVASILSCHYSLCDCCQLIAQASWNPWWLNHQVSILKFLGWSGLFWVRSRIGAWSLCKRGRWFTYAIGNNWVHCIVDNTLSSRWKIAFETSCLLFQVKVGPLNPRSTRPVSNTNCRKSLLFGFSFWLPPYFSSSAATALKSPIKHTGLVLSVISWMYCQICLFSVWVGSPYTQINSHICWAGSPIWTCILYSDVFIWWLVIVPVTPTTTTTLLTGLGQVQKLSLVVVSLVGTNLT